MRVSIPKITIRRDLRFNLDENWDKVVEVVKEAQTRSVFVTPITVFDEEGQIEGWYLHGFKPTKVS